MKILHITKVCYMAQKVAKLKLITLGEIPHHLMRYKKMYKEWTAQGVGVINAIEYCCDCCILW